MKKKCRCGKIFEPYQYRNSTIKTNKCPKCLALKGSKMVHKEVEDKRKDKAYYEKKLEVEINTICRIIDYGQNCISCTAKGNQAGHRHSVGGNGSLRYNLHNLHIQEYSCNGEKGGNISKYDEGLVKQYGIQYQQYIQFNIVALYPRLGLSKEELIEAIIKAKEVKKTLMLLQIKHPPEDRIELRDWANEKIGIYKHKYINN